MGSSDDEFHGFGSEAKQKHNGEVKERKRSMFSKEEDEKLIKLVNFYHKKRVINWTVVSQQMGTRSVRQCKERWMNYLDNRRNKCEFTPEENLFILNCVEKIGHKWSFISSQMKNRTVFSIKLQYSKLMRRNVNVNNVLDMTSDASNSKPYQPPTVVKKEEKFETKIDNELFQSIFDSIDFNELEKSELSLM
ncbi:RNA polymerase II transcription regulator recruiting protein [Trichomonas vaginalis G3]|uniref:RNA polymerase II transcription regulator recruiting protein n=1 Tax=Trichomonas vaginalis (strain ATCC PRA-98 / G3) TaxID=412133 RepID=UPI0021E5510D|nr:RNA polymerase II transcription regulator recruiting protein [Trichomonas vaginalis G3]KAI5517088.1 RNA polymerase II transcription regulator recruiting protein [Trichomonas vaginalis G3]